MALGPANELKRQEIARDHPCPQRVHSLVKQKDKKSSFECRKWHDRYRQSGVSAESAVRTWGKAPPTDLAGWGRGNQKCRFSKKRELEHKGRNSLQIQKCKRAVVNLEELRGMMGEVTGMEPRSPQTMKQQQQQKGQRWQNKCPELEPAHRRTG